MFSTLVPAKIRPRHATTPVLLLTALLGGVVSPRALRAQNAISQTGTYDTAAITRLHRENAAEFPAPVVVVDPHTKTATVVLANHGFGPLTADLHFDFYMVRTDTAHAILTSVDSAPNAHSLVPWVADVPAHVSLAPGAVDTVVLAVTPPASLAPGEYWARLTARTPTIHHPVSMLIMALINEGEGKPPALVQQPATVNMTIEMASQVRVVYRHGAPSAQLTAGTPTVTWAPATGQVHMCTTLQNAGTAAALVNGRFSVVLPSGKDTLSQPFNLEVPPGADAAFAPCFNFSAFALPPGNYTAALAFDANRADIPAALRVPFSAIHVTAPLVVPPGSSPAGPPQPPPAQPLPANGVPVIELLPEKGTLESQLAREAKLAAADGKVPFVEMGASWCGPCQIFLHALGDSLMIDGLKNARVIRIDFDRWGANLLGSQHYTFPRSLPAFFTLRPDGTQGTAFDVNTRWAALAQQYGTLDSRTMAPTFKAFIAEEQARK